MHIDDNWFYKVDLILKLRNESHSPHTAKVLRALQEGAKSYIPVCSALAWYLAMGIINTI